MLRELINKKPVMVVSSPSSPIFSDYGIPSKARYYFYYKYKPILRATKREYPIDEIEMTDEDIAFFKSLSLEPTFIYKERDGSFTKIYDFGLKEKLIERRLVTCLISYEAAIRKYRKGKNARIEKNCIIKIENLREQYHQLIQGYEERFTIFVNKFNHLELRYSEAIVPDSVIYPEDLGGGVYFIEKSDGMISFKEKGVIYNAIHYEVYIVADLPQPYVKTKDFVFFKIYRFG